MSHMYHFGVMQTSFIALTISIASPASSLHPSPDMPKPDSHWTLSCLYSFTFPRMHSWNVTFSDCLSLNNIHLSFLCVFSLLENSFLFYYWITFHDLDIPQFIYSPNDGHLHCFHIWATMNKAGIGMHTQVFVWTSGINLFGWMSRSKNVGSHGMSVFHSIRNCQNVFKVTVSFVFLSGTNENSCCSDDLLRLAFGRWKM